MSLVFASHKETRVGFIVPMEWEMARGAFRVGIKIGDVVANQIARFKDRAALDAACKAAGYRIFEIGDDEWRDVPVAMNGKHTPGPWEAHGRAVYTADKRKHWVSGRDARPVNLAQIRARHDAEIGERVGDIEDNPVAEDEADANARLIAAAPEMLESLRRVLLVVEDIGAHGPGATRDEIIERMHRDDSGVLRSARLAIAKATGGEGGGP